MVQVKTRLILIVQLAGTLAIIAWLPSNLAKAVALPLWWLATFRNLKLAEMVLYCLTCLLFTMLDIVTVAAGQFRFNHPDFLGLPVYEPLMWGFYVVHTWRMVGGAIPTQTDRRAWGLAALLAATFVFVTHPTLLAIVAGLLVAGGLLVYRGPEDFAFVGYMMLLGAVVEFAGVLSEQWYYPQPTHLGVPAWSAAMWGGIGLLLRRMALPTLLAQPFAAHGSALPNDPMGLPKSQRRSSAAE